MIFIPSQHIIDSWTKYNALVAEYNARFGQKISVGHIEDIDHWSQHFKYVKWSMIHKRMGFLMIEN